MQICGINCSILTFAGFCLNGALLYDSSDSSTAFNNINTSKSFVPAITLCAGERAQINFGRSSEKLKYYSSFEGAGYRPLCSHNTLRYNIPLWYSYHGGFKSLVEQKYQKNSKLVMHQTSSGLSVQAKDSDYAMQTEQELLRLNMSFTVTPSQTSLTPTLVARPGIFCPISTFEDVDFLLDDELSTKCDDRPISFSVVFPAGQAPSSVFLGWTTPSFRYIASQFSMHQPGAGYGQTLKTYSTSTQESAGLINDQKTAFMVCLSDLLPVQSGQLVSSVQ